MVSWLGYIHMCAYNNACRIAGKVDLEELISAFKDLGLEIDIDEARKLLSRLLLLFRKPFEMNVNGSFLKHNPPTRMDKDGSLNISFNEWRDFMLLAPSTDIHDLIKFWRHSTVSRGNRPSLSLYL